MTLADTRTGWRFPRLQTGRLAAEALRTAFAAAGALWWIWLLWGAANLAVLLGMSLALQARPYWIASAVAISVASSVVSGVASAVCTRTYLRGLPGRWRLDRGLGAYVAFLVVMGLLQTGVPLLIAVLTFVAAHGRLPINPLMVRPTQAWAGLAVFVALLWPSARLTLWPVGMLMDDPRTTPGFSWRAMRGAVWPYFLAYLLLVGAPFVTYSVSWSWFAALHSPANLGIASVSYTLLVIVTSSLHAVVYRTRLGPSAEKLADVFA